MKNKRNILCGAFAVLALSLAGGSLAFTANAEETAAKTLADISIGMVKGASMRIGSAEEGNTEESTGLRFTMQVSKADYEALENAVRKYRMGHADCTRGKRESRGIQCGKFIRRKCEIRI